MTQEQREILSPGNGAGEGLSWSWHLDLETLLTALSEPAPWNRPSPVASRPAEPAADLAGASPAAAEPSATRPSDTGSLAAGLPDGECPAVRLSGAGPAAAGLSGKIGRASCRERV